MKIFNEAIHVTWNLPEKTNHVSALEMGIIQNEENKLNQISYEELATPLGMPSLL